MTFQALFSMLVVVKHGSGPTVMRHFLLEKLNFTETRVAVRPRPYPGFDRLGDFFWGDAMVKFHKDGDRMGITTDCTNRVDFIDQVAAKLGYIIEHEKFANDWEFQLLNWLPQIVEIAESFSNHNTTVKKIVTRQIGFIESFSVVA